MKKLLLTVWIICFAVSPEIGFPVDLDVQTGLHSEWWSDNADTKARQSYVPLRIEGRQNDFSFRILTAYVDTRIDPPGREARSLNHLLDTKINFSYEILDKLPVDMLLGLDFNIPSGKTDLHDRDLVLIMDPDLISINNFGEGFNVNPTLTFTKEWGDWVAGIGFGYVFRGSYDFSKTLRDFDPGNIANLNAQIRYDFSTNWHGRLFGSFAWFEKEDWRRTFVGEERFQEGPFFLIGSGVSYTQPKWDAGFTLRSILRQKNKFQDGGRFATEESYSHGDEWIGDLSFRYLLSDKTTLRSYLQGLLITRNDYPSSPLFVGGRPNRFVGQREKFSLGLGINRTLSSTFEGVLYTKGFLMHDEKALFPESREERRYKGIGVGLQLIARF
jgi:hypothetical protein